MKIYERVELWRNDPSVSGESIAAYFTDATPLTDEYLRGRFGDKDDWGRIDLPNDWGLSAFKCTDTGQPTAFWVVIENPRLPDEMSCVVTTIGELNSLLYAAGVRE